MYVCLYDIVKSENQNSLFVYFSFSIPSEVNCVMSVVQQCKEDVHGKVFAIVLCY